MTQRFNTGTFLLITRAKPWVVPVAVEGSHEAWPRDRKGPRLTGRIGVMFGEPVAAETLLAMEPAEAMEHLRAAVEKCGWKWRRRFLNPSPLGRGWNGAAGPGEGISGRGR